MPDNPPPLEPHGNTATFFNDAAGAKSGALNLLSDSIGFAADLSGAISAGLAFYNAIKNGLGPSDSDLDQLAEEVAILFDELKRDLGLQQILDRNTLALGYLHAARKRLSGLKDTLSSEVTPEIREDQIYDCTLALTNLAGTGPNPKPGGDKIWYLNYDWQAFFSDYGVFLWNEYSIPGSDGDLGYGSVAPANEEGYVFRHDCALQYYLATLHALLIVGKALEGDAFIDNYRPDLTTAVDLLTKRHDKIVRDGIKLLVPDLFVPIAVPCGATGIRWAYDLSEADTYFGAVEVFSGVSNTRINYKLKFGIEPQEDLTKNVNDAITKLTLRALALGKDIYTSLGLPAVVDAIKSLNRLLGRTGTPDRYDSWSFRKDLIPILGVKSVNGAFSVRTIEKAIWEAFPTNPPPGENVSLRRLLSDF